MADGRNLEWDWYPGTIPSNAQLEEGAYLETTYSFHLCRSAQAEAVWIGRGASVYLGTMFDLGPRARVRIGRYSLVNGAWFMSEAAVTIGDYCLISWNVVLMDSWRAPREVGARRRMLELLPSRMPRRVESEEPAQPICLERNVWLGFDVCVLPGVTIGEGSVVGARSVVVEDVPPYAVVAGNPARVIRTLERSATDERDEPRAEDP